MNIHCILSNDSVQYVNLNYSLFYDEYNFDFQGVNDAEVFVKYISERDTIIYDFEKNEAGVWSSCFVPVFGAEYSLHIIIDNEVFSAETKYPLVREEAISYQLAYNDYFTESNDEKRIWRYCVDYDMIGDAILWYSGMDYSEEDGLFRPITMLYSDNPYCDKFSVSDVMINAVEEFNDPSWLPSPPTLKSLLDLNLVNGAGKIKEPLLCFVKNNGEIDRRGDLMYDSCIRMSNFADLVEIDVINANYFFVVGNFKPGKDGKAHKNSYVLMQYVSKEYDEYLKDITTFEISRKNGVTELSEIYSYKKMYSNIRAGGNKLYANGVFGASFKIKLPVS